MRLDLEVDDHANVHARPYKGGLVIWIKDIDSESDLSTADTLLESYLGMAVDDMLGKPKET